MTLHDVSMMWGYWRRNPPLRVLVTTIAVALGIPVENFAPKKADKYDLTPDPDKHMTKEAFELLLAQTGGRLE